MTQIESRREFQIPLFLKISNFGPLHSSHSLTAKKKTFLACFFMWFCMCTVSNLTPPGFLSSDPVSFIMYINYLFVDNFLLVILQCKEYIILCTNTMFSAILLQNIKILSVFILTIIIIQYTLHNFLTLYPIHQSLCNDVSKYFSGRTQWAHFCLNMYFIHFAESLILLGYDISAQSSDE